MFFFFGFSPSHLKQTLCLPCGPVAITLPFLLGLALFLPGPLRSPAPRKWTPTRASWGCPGRHISKKRTNLSGVVIAKGDSFTSENQEWNKKGSRVGKEVFWNAQDDLISTYLGQLWALCILPLCQACSFPLKNYSQPKKWRVMFYSVGIFRTSSLGGSISSNPERTAPRKCVWA